MKGMLLKTKASVRVLVRPEAIAFVTFGEDMRINFVGGQTLHFPMTELPNLVGPETLDIEDLEDLARDGAPQLLK